MKTIARLTGYVLFLAACYVTIAHSFHAAGPLFMLAGLFVLASVVTFTRE
jgi:hypothetical protein